MVSHCAFGIDRSMDIVAVVVVVVVVSTLIH